MHKYTAEQLDYIKANRRKPRRELADAFNEKFGASVSADSMATVCGRRGWLTGRTGRFKPGHETWNEGIEFEAGGRSSEHQYKPGNNPHTWRPIGSYAEGKNGNLKIKFSDEPGRSNRNWEYVHRLIWVQHHKQDIPKGHIVRFKDGDNRNFDIDNLQLVSRSEHIVVNNIIRKQPLPPPTEAMDAILSVAKLQLLAAKVSG